MKFGAFVALTDYSMGPAELGKALEERGFESLFVPEHTHIPVPTPDGRQFSKPYMDLMDPFLALTAVAAATERLLLGTGVCLVVQHDPIVLAKEISTLDLLSGGRVLFGVGAGGDGPELRDHGVDPSRRFKLLRERVEAMQHIWSEAEAEYHGEFVDFDPIWQWPKPVQKPHPPVLIGGNAPNTFQRVVRYGDGWIPLLEGLELPLGDRIAELNALAEEHGRDRLPVSVIGASRPPGPEVIEQLAEAGVERLVIPFPPADAEKVLPLLDEQAKVAEQYS